MSADIAQAIEGPPPRLVCLGLSAFDLTWVVPGLPHGGKTRALDHYSGGGGMAANAAVAAARLGAQVQFWGRAGQDAAGRAMRQELAELGVDVAHFRLFEHARSSVSGIVVDARGERMIVNFRGRGLPDEADWLPLETIGRVDAVLADPRWPQGALALFRQARSLGVPTILDGDVSDSEVFDLLLPHTDFAVFSEQGLSAYAGSADAEAGLRLARGRGCALAAVTRGERGVAWLGPDDDEPLRIPAFAVEAVDTTGAGDVFHGALAYGLGRRWPVADAFRFGAAVAAIKCTRAGSRAGTPDLRAVLSFLQDSKE